MNCMSDSSIRDEVQERCLLCMMKNKMGSYMHDEVQDETLETHQNLL